MKTDTLAIRNALANRDFYRQRAAQWRDTALIIDQAGGHSTAFDLRVMAAQDERAANGADTYARECGYRGE